MPALLVPADFEVPASMHTDHFTLLPLTVHHLVKDYEAVMTSVDRLQGVFGEVSSWPSPDLSLEQNLIDLAWHQKEFQRRTSFAYTVLSPDEQTCLGCVYLLPPRDPAGSDVDVYLWVRTSAYETGMARCCPTPCAPGWRETGPSPVRPIPDAHSPETAPVECGASTMWNLARDPCVMWRLAC